VPRLWPAAVGKSLCAVTQIQDRTTGSVQAMILPSKLCMLVSTWSAEHAVLRSA